VSPQRWAALYFFAFFGANGAVFPYYTLYYEDAGVESGGIGLLVAAPTLVTLVAAPAWGGIADALRLHRRLLPAALLATATMTALLLNSHTFGALMLFVVLQAFCFVLYMTGMGATAAMLGLAVAVAGVSELPVFLLAPRIVQRGQAHGLLLLGFASYAVRAFAYALSRTPAMGVASQLLHEPSFSASWTGSVTYAREIVPEGWGATAQAAMGSTFFGLAVSAGAIIGGLLYDRIGPVALFQFAGLLALAGLGIFAWQMRAGARKAAGAREQA
jgi:predicted MFS family arabinose efflux permease